MCIKILNCGLECAYDAERPLEEQLSDSSEVHINYEPKDPSMDRFLGEMERLCKTGISATVNVKISHNDYLSGVKAKKQIRKFNKDLNLNEAIKLLTKLHSTIDKSLEELSNACLNESKRVR